MSQHHELLEYTERATEMNFEPKRATEKCFLRSDGEAFRPLLASAWYLCTIRYCQVTSIWFLLTSIWFLVTFYLVLVYHLVLPVDFHLVLDDLGKTSSIR